jgi:hypothetical protein
VATGMQMMMGTDDGKGVMEISRERKDNYTFRMSKHKVGHIAS